MKIIYNAYLPYQTIHEYHIFSYPAALLQECNVNFDNVNAR